MLTKLFSNSEKILNKRYYIDGEEDWPKLCHRVVDNVVPNSCANYKYGKKYVENLSSSCFYLINELFFIPNSPTMFNAGTEYPMLSACFIIDVEDDLPSIYDSVKESAIIHKFGGGVGLNFGKLRGNGSQIATTHGKSGGAVSFVKVFSSGTEEITAAGKRKGANMGQLPVWHCDVEEFIECKQVEGEISNFNLTIQLTDEFMSAVESDSSFNLYDPKDMSVVKVVRARDLMDKMVAGAKRNGEPGICFIDRINRDNPTPHLGDITCSNPCQPGWATVLTPDGIRIFNDIYVGSIIWSGKRWTVVTDKKSSGIKPIYNYHTRAGVFCGTENHRILQGGEKVEVEKAEAIDVCSGVCIDESSIDKFDIMNGLVLGDGTYHKASNLVVLIVGDNDHSYFEDEDIKDLFVKYRPGIKEKYWEVKTDYKILPLTYNREVPSEVFYGPQNKIRGFLRGLYSANGSVVGKRVCLKASSKTVILEVQAMLSSLGIISYYTTNRPSTVQHRNGVYTSKVNYDLNIGTSEGRNRFKDLIGFVQPYKDEKLLKACAHVKRYREPKRTYEIVEKEYVSTEEVYDITVDDLDHTYWTGGLLVSNCGEFYSIPYNSCNLGSLNLTKYSMVGGQKFNWDLFEEHIRLATQYLDCIIDANLYPLKKIDVVSKSTRPLGLGVMGFADILILMGIKYNSIGGFEFAEKISEFLTYVSLDESVELSKIRGSYPEFRVENHKYENYASTGSMDWPKLVKKIAKFGLRNSHTTVIAPTGTIATIANEVSHGIEPLFAKEYDRHIMGEVHKGYHHLYKKFLSGEFKSSEDMFVLAKDISWEDHIEMQTRWQLYVNNGISKTINMPGDATEKDVYSAFMLAHKKGLKGLTVYVDGSREQEVIVSKRKDASFKHHNAPKRPEVLQCDIHHTQVQGKQWVVFVGLLDGRPYEIFAGLSKYVELPKKYTDGFIVKRSYKTKNSEYDLVIDTGNEDKLVVKNIVETFENANHGVLGRLISLSLRHGTKSLHISEQLLKDTDFDFTTYAKCIGRIFSKKYVSDGEESESKRGCSECGGKLVYQEGCKICLSCGFGKCS